MKIMMALHHSPNRDAGAPGATLRLMEALQQLGHHVEPFFFSEAFRDPRETVQRSIAYPWVLGRHLRRVARHFDIIDASLGDAWVWDAVRHRDRGARPRLVGRSHGLEHVAHEVLLRSVREGRSRLSRKYFVYHGGFRLWEVARTCRRSDAVVVLNEVDRDYVVQRLHARPGAVTVIPHGVAEYCFRFPSARDVGDGPVRLLFVGRWSEAKGVRDLVTAVDSVLGDGQRVTLTAAGVGLQQAEVLATVPARVREVMTVRPHVPHTELPRVYGEHDVFVFPSLAEGFGLVVAEAMAAGRPVITTPVGVGTALRHGVDSLIVPPRDPSALADAIRLLAVNRWLRARLGAPARRAAERYRWGTVAGRTAALYEEVLAQC